MRISDWSSDVCSSDLYKTKAKNAQEAHEAIRPTDLFRRPQDVARALDDDHRRLYELIWKDRKSVVSGKSVSVSVDLGGRRILKKKHQTITIQTQQTNKITSIILNKYKQYSTTI